MKVLDVMLPFCIASKISEACQKPMPMTPMEHSKSATSQKKNFLWVSRIVNENVAWFEVSVKNLVPVQIWHPPCNLPHDQCGHSFCERWALVVVLLHHHLTDELASPLQSPSWSVWPSVLWKVGLGYCFVASSYWWACVNHRNILLRAAAVSIFKHSRRPFLMQVS